MCSDPPTSTQTSPPPSSHFNPQATSFLHWTVPAQLPAASPPATTTVPKYQDQSSTQELTPYPLINPSAPLRPHLVAGSPPHLLQPSTPTKRRTSHPKLQGYPSPQDRFPLHPFPRLQPRRTSCSIGGGLTAAPVAAAATDTRATVSKIDILLCCSSFCNLTPTYTAVSFFGGVTSIV